MMMALKLDAICAKLKLNISSAESGISISENNNDSKSPEVISRPLLKFEIKDSDVRTDPTLSAGLGKTSTEDASVVKKSVSADCSTLSFVSRRNRRKNFQPRCIQEVCSEEILEEKAELTLAEEDDRNSFHHDDRSGGGATIEANGELEVLDLRVGDASSHEVGILNEKHSDDDDDDCKEEPSSDNCCVIDLSVRHKTDVSLPSKTLTSNATRKGNSKVSALNLTSEVALDVPANSDGPPINDFALQTMNKLLKIYGLSEESDSDGKRLPSASLNPLLWTLDSVNSMSVLPRSSASSSSSIIPEISKLSFPSDDLYLMKSSASGSSQSTETNTNASVDESSTLPGLTLKSLKQRSFIPDFGEFSSKLSKRSNVKQHLPDYNKYAKRFNSFDECRSASCRESGYKEHFHCTACTSRVCLKKEEMIRHFKWHKKREDSLQHGFMRYSPMDDCSKKFSTHCSHNGKHTHYHCLQNGCSKVYISTSDVQMHANYHRKDSAIIQEGFQRFRATENCAMTSCAFAGQKTTHFHCRRPGCNFTFKNKADMEKHKTYHQKDEILARDGFKKFMKYEQCHFAGCHYSRVSNHIHCIRPDCNYVLHSTGQLYSHKRKHERREVEHSVYKQLESSSLMDINNSLSSVPECLSSDQTAVSQSATLSAAAKMNVSVSQNIVKLSDSKSGNVAESQNKKLISDELKVEVKKEFPEEKEEQDQEHLLSPGLAKLASDLAGKDLGGSLNIPIPFASLPGVNGRSDDDDDDDDDEETQESSSSVTEAKFTPSVFFMPKTLPLVNEKKERDESWKKYLTRYTANDPCHAQCQFLYKDHYHCSQLDCGWLFRSKDGVREHAKFHEQQDRITALTFMKYEAETKCIEGCEYSEKILHYHCLWTNCSHVISSKDSVFSRLEHHKFHDNFGRKTSGFSCGSSVDSLKRKRGRPPKFPKNDIPVIPKVEMTEEEILTQTEVSGLNSPIANGFQKYDNGQSCPDDKCIYSQTEHYHCVRPRCHHVTNRSDVLALHAKDFHSFISIVDGFEFFDRNVNCRRPHCHSNQSNRHFHCVRPNCDYSFVRYSTMVQHDRKHRAAGNSVDLFRIKAASKFKTNHSASLCSSSAANATSATRRTSPSDAHSTAALFPVSSLVSVTETPVLLSSVSSVAMAPVLLTSLQPLSAMSGQTIAPIIMGPIKQGLQGHDLQLTSSPLKLVSIAPKPSAVMTFQTPVSNVEIKAPVVAGAIPSHSRGEVPLTVLLQQKTSTVPPVDWVSMKLKMHHRIHQNCGRPFCKLKKKDHYHCFDCNQAFSDPARLKSHITRHGIALENVQMARDNQATNGELKMMQEENATIGEADMASNAEDDEVEDNLSQQDVQCSEEIHQNVTTEKSAQLVGDNLEESDEFDDADVGRLVIDLSSIRSSSDGGASVQGSDEVSVASGVSLGSSSVLDASSCSSKFVRKREFDEGACGAGEPKKLKIATGGYEKFRFSEDCGQDRCAYRLSMTHYHCSRPDCGYSFCDHSRFLQHSDRHQRIDVVMGDQFQHFHAKTDCRHVGCEHARTATHFHCLSCSYVCTDSSKVVAHRKHHSKMNRITENGFRKFCVGEDCESIICIHRFKQTHYHCLHSNCGHVVMGPAQMGSHKAKHINNVKNNFAE